MKEFPLERHDCPYCGSEETAAGIAFADLVAADPTLVPCIKTTFSPIMPGPGALETPTMDVFVVYWDNCAACLREFVRRIDIQSMPRETFIPQGGLSRH